MLNNYSIAIGFMLDSPKLIDEEKNTCRFTLVVTDNKSTKEIPCVATNKTCSVFMTYGQKGTFWAVGGVFFQINKVGKKGRNTSATYLKVLESELLERPSIPGIGIKEFVGKYSMNQIVKRAKRDKAKKKGGK